jgi:hypothetical protein
VRDQTRKQLEGHPGRHRREYLEECLLPGLARRTVDRRGDQLRARGRRHEPRVGTHGLREGTPVGVRVPERRRGQQSKRPRRRIPGLQRERRIDRGARRGGITGCKACLGQGKPARQTLRRNRGCLAPRGLRRPGEPELPEHLAQVEARVGTRGPLGDAREAEQRVDRPRLPLVLAPSRHPVDLLAKRRRKGASALGRPGGAHQWNLPQARRCATSHTPS